MARHAKQSEIATDQQVVEARQQLVHTMRTDRRPEVKELMSLLLGYYDDCVIRPRGLTQLVDPQRIAS